MKVVINFNDLIGWGLILGGIVLMIILFAIAWVQSKIKDFKDWKAKKKREKEANGE